MITLAIDTPDRTLCSIELDPNELNVLRQTILLGLDDATDAGLDTDAVRTLASMLSLHC